MQNLTLSWNKTRRIVLFLHTEVFFRKLVSTKNFHFKIRRLVKRATQKLSRSVFLFELGQVVKFLILVLLSSKSFCSIFKLDREITRFAVFDVYAKSCKSERDFFLAKFLSVFEFFWERFTLESNALRRNLIKNGRVAKTLIHKLKYVKTFGVKNQN